MARLRRSSWFILIVSNVLSIRNLKSNSDDGFALLAGSIPEQSSSSLGCESRTSNSFWREMNALVGVFLWVLAGALLVSINWRIPGLGP